jgi:hypothetical protein
MRWRCVHGKRRRSPHPYCASRAARACQLSARQPAVDPSRNPRNVPDPRCLAGPAPSYPLVVAANRDEFYPVRRGPCRFQDVPVEATEARYPGRARSRSRRHLAGLMPRQRFAAVTNVREGAPRLPAPAFARCPGRPISSPAPPPPRITWHLFAACSATTTVSTCLSRRRWRSSIAPTAARQPLRSLEPGIYGLSNHLLDTPWPKLASAKERFAAALGAPARRRGFFCAARR